jgi:hypothetical protein
VTSTVGTADELRRLADLHAAGELNDVEFTQAKARVLQQRSTAVSPTALLRFLPNGPRDRLLSGWNYVRSSRKRMVIAGAIVLVLIIAVGRASNSGSSGSGDLQTTGNAIASELLAKLGDTQGQPLANVTCPDERLVVGDSVDCTLYFQDGSFKAMPVVVQEQDGHIKLKIGS